MTGAPGVPAPRTAAQIQCPAAQRSLRLITLVLAFACGASVANLYYAQPLLDPISRSFDVSKGSATLAVTLTQVGYALGLVLLLPLGDIVESRRLTSRMLLLTTVALIVAACAPDLWVFFLASVVVGVTSVVAQILIPLAAHLAPADSRGKFVGQVMSGLLLGIMLARSAASFTASIWGWRSIYAISAVLMLITAFTLMRILPPRPPDHHAPYGALLMSSVGLLRHEPILLRRALAQACMFGSFTAFWTGIVYELIAEHGLSQGEIAVFALVGASGAVAAPIAGRLGDAGHGPSARIAAIAIATAAMVLARLGASNVVLLAVAGVLLDLAVQGHQVLGQRDIYALRDDARARITSAYMFIVFAGGAVSSAATGLLIDGAGWSSVTAFGAALPLVAAVVWVVGHGRER